MKTELKTQLGRGTLATGLAAILLASMALVTLPAVAASSSTSFNNVQVFVNTSSSNENYSFFFTAYNLTGQLVGSTQTPFPAAAFELPAGSYLFTVSAISQSPYYCNVCAQPVSTGSAGAGSAAAGATKAGPNIPVPYSQPASEYGFKEVTISSPDSFTIDTKNVTQFPTTPVSVKVSFLNGTAAAGAWVSTSIVGQWYYWWGSDSSVVTSAQTGPDGVANLVLPAAPSVVSAWDWVKVDLPASQTTTEVTVGGQKVNVTVYWEPTYVGLAASTLIIPPTDNVNLTLTYQQQPNYWFAPGGAQVSPATPGATSGSVSNAPSAVPNGTSQAASQSGSSQYYLPTSIPSLAAGSSTSASVPVVSAGYLPVIEGLAIGAAITALLALSFVTMRRRATKQ
jgi:hypothetical protein